MNPSKYFIGQEFINDIVKINVEIKFVLNSNIFLSEFNFSHRNFRIECYHNTNFKINYYRTISKKLFGSIKKNKEYSRKFLYGYFNDIIHSVNQNINDQKYRNGHVLNKPITLYDIIRIEVREMVAEENIVIDGGLVFDTFEKSSKLAQANDFLYIREYIDSITSFLYNNYDDCIRKLITSLENYYDMHNFKGNFNQKLKKLLTGKYHISQWENYLKILLSNMKFIYRVRNKITHDKLRIKFNGDWSGICDAGIGTLYYIYNNYLTNYETIKYLESIVFHYKLIKQESEFISLDTLKQITFNEKPNNKFIKNPSDLDKFTFQGLRIPEEIKQNVLNDNS